jgi:hypothetical protein
VIRFTAPLWLWNAEGGSWHFVTVPEEQSAEIRFETLGSRRGFGSVRVEASVGEVRWRTSVFPQKAGTFLLPVKADVRRRASIRAGDEVSVALELI